MVKTSPVGHTQVMAKSKKPKGSPKPRADQIRDRADPTAERLPAGSLQSHPNNWRVHGTDQRSGMRDLYKELGFVKPVDCYVPQPGDPLVVAGKLKPGVLCLMDGHLRVEELPAEYPVPINRTDLTEIEALKYLATCDPLSALADQDDGKLIEVLSQVDSDSAAVQKMMADLVDVDDGEKEPEGAEDEPGGKYQILIECEGEDQQRELLERLMTEGLNVRSLIA